MANVTLAILFWKKGRKNKVSRRIGVVAVLALVLVLGFATVVLAAQNVDYSGSPNDGVNDFAATQTDQIYFPNADPSQYKIHSNYTATTDACASCHSTHTAVGEALLQLGSAEDICMACHDGSITTTYDVKNGLIGDTTMRTAGGLFGDSTSNSAMSKSTHNVSGSMSIYAAPGGPGTPGVEADNPSISWNIEFGCQSCHSPHGTGGNARILNPDANGYAQAAYLKGAYTLGSNGINVGGSQGVPLYKVTEANGQVYYYSNWKKTDLNEKDQWLWSGHSYKSNTKVFVDNTLKTLDVDYTLDNSAGFTKVTFKTPLGTPGVVTANIYPGLRVQMNITNYLQTSEKVQHISGLNDFCGACHTDYNTTAVDNSAAELNGTYTEAYRHAVNFTRSESAKTKIAGFNMPLEIRNGKNYVTCETCHVAHGTNSTYWVDTLKAANAGTLPAGLEATNLKEIAGSSALKRVPNMGTCEACHAKGLAAQGAQVNSSVPAPSLISSNTPGGGYVFQQACKECHANVSEHFANTWHVSMSRPGVAKATWESVKPSLVNADGTFNATYAQALDAKSITGFAQALYTTMTELAGKNMFDEKGAIVTDPAIWKAKNIDANKILVWTTGTTKQEICVKGSAIGDANPDKWFIVTFWGYEPDPTAFTQAEKEDYTCGSAALGCHTTGKTTDNGSSDLTAWLQAAVTGTQPFELGITCESCHGQGGNHVKAPSAKNIVNPATFSPVEQTVGLGATKVGNTWSAAGANKFLNPTSLALSCGKCHSGGKHQGDYYSAIKYSGTTTNQMSTPSKHFTSGLVSCNSCHDTHQESKGLIAYGTAQQTCESCHGKLANFNLSTYMPALERDAELHEHQFQTGVSIPSATTQSDAGRRNP